MTYSTFYRYILVILRFLLCSIQPFDRWGFKQNLEGDDEEAFLSLAKKMDRRSEQLKVRENPPSTALDIWNHFGEAMILAYPQFIYDSFHVSCIISSLNDFGVN